MELAAVPGGVHQRQLVLLALLQELADGQPHGVGRQKTTAFGASGAESHGRRRVERLAADPEPLSV